MAASPVTSESVRGTNERGPHHGLYEGQEHKPKGPRVRVQVVAEGPDEPEEPDAPGPTFGGGTATCSRLAHIRVTHRTAFPSSTSSIMPPLAFKRQGQMSQGLIRQLANQNVRT